MNKLLNLIIENENEKIKKTIKNGANLKLKDKDNTTLLMYSARYSKEKKIIDLLLNAGLEVFFYVF
jgi:ankyrin repeat protein